jgi:hypothetical protein
MSIDDKDIYEDYRDSTIGLKESDVVNVVGYHEATNPTKSPYDNIIGWVILRK